MRTEGPGGKLVIAFVVGISLLSSPQRAMAADKPPDASKIESQTSRRWLLHIDATGVVPHPDADVSVSGAHVAGGSLSVNNAATVTGDVGYFVTPALAVNLYAGVPARGAIKGGESLSGLGPLATTLYGIAILSAEYRPKSFGAFKPYVGFGPGYAIFLDTRHETLGSVKLPNAWGVAFSVGADYDINERWTINAYLKQMLLSTTVTATLAGAPTTSKTALNPTLFGIGVGFRF